MSNSYNLSNQKLLHDIKILEENLHCLKSRTLTPPCISIIGIDKLQIRPLHHTHDEPYINDVIKKLFIQLKIPHFWIHSIEIPQNSQKSHHHSFYSKYLSDNRQHQSARLQHFNPIFKTY